MKRISNQVTAEIDIAALLFRFPDFCDGRERRNERGYSSPFHLGQMNETGPRLGDEEVAQVNGDFRNCLQSVEINLLTRWSGWINPA